METVSLTRLSSKGQVVIPESVRKRLGLESGDQFVVLAEGDAVILKVISRPSMKDFDAIIAGARKQARTAGMTRIDVTRAIRKARAHS